MAGDSNRTRVPEGRYAKIAAVATVAAVIVAYLTFAATAHWPPFSAQSRGPSTSAGPASPSHAANAGAWAVSWSGPVGITTNGLNFDNKPPSSQSADVIFTSLLAVSPPTILATWPQSGRPTPTQCLNWVTTHPSQDINTVTVGMQICLKTQQGRPVLLRVTGTTQDEVQAHATVWQHT